MAITSLLKYSGTELAKIKTYEVEYNKLWTDADRNLAGTMTATLIGIFPKIKVTFATMTRTELATLLGIINSGSLSLAWYDAISNTAKTSTFYSNDVSVKVDRKSKERIDEVSVNFIAYSKYV